jgi:uncharacterized protein DUF3800
MRSPADAARLVADLCALFRGGRAKGICVLTAYIDDGGSYPDTVSLTLGGCIANESEWLKASADWHRTLCNYAAADYHGVDCHQHQKDFKGWPIERSDALEFDLINVLRKHDIWFLGAFVEKQNYANLPIDRQQQLNEPYLLLFEHCLDRINDTGLPPNEPIALVFEETKEFAARAMAVYDVMKRKPKWRNRLVSCSKASKGDFTPLQCADLVAYWFNKTLCERETVDKSFTLARRPQYKRLIQDNRAKFVEFDEQGLATKIGEVAAQ